MDIDRERVREAIVAAFQELPIPDPVTLLWDADAQTGTAVGEKVRAAFAGRNWQSLDAAFLTSERFAFNHFLSPVAYRYYLPSLLITSLSEFTDNSELTYNTLLDLVPDFEEVYYRGADPELRARQAVFTSDQYLAVCSYLGLAFERLPIHGHLAAKALDWGWNQRDTPALRAVKAFQNRVVVADP